MQRILYSVAVLFFAGTTLPAQSNPDTLQPKLLKEVQISVQRSNLERLKPVEGTYLWSGKKNEVISLENLDANIAEKTPRQIFAKVPGVFVYDMDGSGNQTNISTRGLDPHRGWEFNVRANGMIANSDIYGYPASHFSLPLEAVNRIELVRGTGALQYGAQFGGMLNYVLKQPDTTRKIGLESINAMGSFGLLSSYNAIGGKLGKFQYFIFHSNRKSDGYRENSRSDYNGQGLVLHYRPGVRITLEASLLRSSYIYQIPGPLTDEQFTDNPRQSSRARNFFNPEIYIPSVALHWKTGNRSRISWSASAVLGERRSVMFDRLATIPDTIQKNTLQYAGRQVDIDQFNSHTAELRFLQGWGKASTLSFSIQYFYNDLNRHQQGRGTTGTNFDLTIDPLAGWGRDLHLKSHNIALAVENKFQLTRKWSVSPGVRYEYGNSRLSGKTTYYDPADLPHTIRRNYPLLGLNTEYAIHPQQQFYAGWSQAYRPVIFKDIIPANPYERSDKNLQDAFGYNAEIGWRGTTNGLKWDVGAFALQYNNRLGSLAQFDNELDTFVLFRTNIGNSRTIGLEMFAEYNFRVLDVLNVNVFSSTAWFHAVYLGDSLRAGARENLSIKGNKVESVPEWISRNGLNIRYRQLSVSVLYSYTGATFSDPFNTSAPSASGAVGPVPEYGLLDVNAAVRLGKFMLRLSINNLADKQYFTKRPTFYPGPGIWPSDGRSVVLSVGVKL
jgi:Fe(3+) dicitrate transport protein